MQLQVEALGLRPEWPKVASPTLGCRDEPPQVVEVIARYGIPLFPDSSEHQREGSFGYIPLSEMAIILFVYSLVYVII